jgi:type VI secretion system secreted protein VgrG
METRKRIKFTFVSAGVSEDTFIVVKFRGVEEISKPYEFDISLASEDPEIDLKKVLQSPATFTIFRDDEEYPIFGVLSQFEQLHEDKQYTYYRAVLVPRLWEADLYRENQLFLEKSVKDIIEEILKQTGLTTRDYELHLKRTYKKWEYICQYQETDLDFISRWMEREGIYYFFEQTDENEKVIITDNSSIHKDIPGEKKVHYSPPSEVIPDEKNVITSLICRQKTLPKKVMLKDYNYRKPSLDLTVENEVDAKGKGTVYIYGEHYKSPEEGKDLAKIRGEELKAREEIYYGESSVPALRPGYIFELDRHYRDSYNGKKYMVIEVEHEGSQEGTFSPGFEREISKGEKEQDYTNRFVAIPADVQFRPERKTQKPRFNGTMNARVDAAGDGQYAEIDEEGRYKVVLPFDMSGNKDGKASRWVRMAQPYAGAEYGMHFPLHKGTEVLLTFVDGDPDRPVISGSIPNPETTSPVNSENLTQSRIKTGGDNELLIEDKDGAQYVKLRSSGHDSYFSLGRDHSSIHCPDGAVIGTLKGVSINAGEGVSIAAGSSNHDEGITNGHATASTIQSVIAGASAFLATASGLAAETVAAAAMPPIVGLVGEIGGLIGGLVLPHVYISAPGKVACMAGAEVVLVGGATLDCAAVGPANFMSAANVLVAGGLGTSLVAGNGDIEMVSIVKDVKLHSKRKNIRATAKRSIFIVAEDLNINARAKKNINLISEEQGIMFSAEKKMIGRSRKDNIELTGKKKVMVTAEDDRLQLMAVNKDILLEAETKIVLKCGDSSISLEKDGYINIKGKTIDVQADSEIAVTAQSKLEMEGGSFTLESSSGQGTVESATILNVKGRQTKINC